MRFERISCFFCLCDYYRKNAPARKKKDKNFLSIVGVSSRSYMVKFANDRIEVVMKRMSDNKRNVENAAGKTGDAVGKGIRKGAKAVNDFGKGIKKGLKKED